MTMAQDGGKVVSLTHWPPLPQGNAPDTYLLEAELTPGPWCDQKDLMSMKNPVTPTGIEPATFRPMKVPQTNSQNEKQFVL